MLEYLVVADDLTGALDTGAQFARQGWRTAVGWGSAPAEGTEVWVLDTESRDLPAAEAGRRVAELAAPLIPVRRLYKKVDSTLRGNVGAELAALLEASGAPRALLAPAFPAQGRTTRDGRQYVHGEPLPTTPYARPPGAAEGRGEPGEHSGPKGMGVDSGRRPSLGASPSPPPSPCEGEGTRPSGSVAPEGDDATIAALLRAQTELTIGVVGLEVVRRGVEGLVAELQARAERILVVDATEEADLATIAQALARVGPDWLAAGSAGLAGAAGARAILDPGSGVPAAWEPPRLVCEQAPGPTGAIQGPILFVAGTLHPCLTRQVTKLLAEGRVTPVREVLGGLLVRGQRVAGERARVVGEALLAGADILLTTEGEPRVAGAGRRVAGLLALITGQALAQAKPGALVLTGGDVAMAVCRALGAEAIAVTGQIEPGIPLGRLAGGAHDGLAVVTKAGGFGDEGVLCRIRRALRERGEQGIWKAGN